MSELETINKLFLELSQFATAQTAKEISLRSELEARDRRIKELEGVICRYVKAVNNENQNVTAEFFDLLEVLKGEEVQGG